MKSLILFNFLSKRCYKPPTILFHSMRKAYEIYKPVGNLVAVGQISINSIINACFNNDYLLKHHNLSFASQIRLMDANELIVNRRTYECLRRGKYSQIKFNYISCFVWFWCTFYGYSFTLTDFLSPTFKDQFIKDQVPGTKV